MFNNFFSKKYDVTAEEVYKTIQSFINGTGGAWDWDDFLYTPLTDPYLDEIRKKSFDLRDDYPPTRPNEYCNDQGLKVLQQFLLDIKTKYNLKI